MTIILRILVRFLIVLYSVWTNIAIAFNIGIMRAFVALRQHAQNVEVLATELKKLESSTHRRFSEIGKVLDALLKQKQQQENQHNRRCIGFKQGDR